MSYERDTVENKNVYICSDIIRGMRNRAYSERGVKSNRAAKNMYGHMYSTITEAHNSYIKVYLFKKRSGR